MQNPVAPDLIRGRLPVGSAFDRIHETRREIPAQGRDDWGVGRPGVASWQVAERKYRVAPGLIRGLLPVGSAFDRIRETRREIPAQGRDDWEVGRPGVASWQVAERKYRVAPDLIRGLLPVGSAFDRIHETRRGIPAQGRDDWGVGRLGVASWQVAERKHRVAPDLIRGLLPVGSAFDRIHETRMGRR